MNIDAQITKLRNLPNFKGKSEEYIRKKAIIAIKKKEFDISKKFADKDEKKEASKLFSHYLEHYTFDSFSDLNTLQDLVYQEILKCRIEKKLNSGLKRETGKCIKCSKKYDDTSIFIDDKTVKILNDIIVKILDLKIKLGIDADKKEDKALTALEQLEKRFEREISENSHEYTWFLPYFCSKCKHIGSESYVLRKRVENFEVLKHPWFAGRFFFNYEILKDVKNGKLTKEDAWRYLSSSGKGKKSISAFSKAYCTDYIDYCFKNWDQIIKYLDINR